MADFIILRGVSAVGKTTVAKKLQEYLGKEKTFFINLDKRPSLDELDFINTENCIAEMFYGHEYTSEPAGWTSVIRTKGFTIKSVVLKGSLKACLEKNRRKSNPMVEEVVAHNYRQYYNEGEPWHNHIKEFASKAKVQEIEIDIDELDIDTIAKKIMGFIGNGSSSSVDNDKDFHIELAYRQSVYTSWLTAGVVELTIGAAAWAISTAQGLPDNLPILFLLIGLVSFIAGIALILFAIFKMRNFRRCMRKWVKDHEYNLEMNLERSRGMNLERAAQWFTIGGTIIAVILLGIAVGEINSSTNLLNETHQSTESLKVIVGKTNDLLLALNKTTAQISQQTAVQAFLKGGDFKVEIKNCGFDEANKKINYRPVIVDKDGNLTPLKFKFYAYFGYYTLSDEYGEPKYGSVAPFPNATVDLIDPSHQKVYELPLSTIFTEAKKLGGSYLFVRSQYFIAPYSDATDSLLTGYVHDERGHLMIAFNMNPKTGEWEELTTNKNSVCK